MVQDTTNHLMPESTPEDTLRITWEFLDERFMTSQQPSQEILNIIMNGPRITLSNVADLTRFAQACASAQCLIAGGSQTFSPLSNQTTQENVFDRLDAELNRKWYKYRLKNDLQQDPVPFEHFAGWIRIQSKVELRRRGQEVRIATPTSSAPSAVSQVKAPITIDVCRPDEVLPTSSVPWRLPSLRNNSPGRQSSPSRNNSRSSDQCRHCQIPGHRISECKQFDRLDAESQRRLIMGICWICMEEGHAAGVCPEKGRSTVSQCTRCKVTHNMKILCSAIRIQTPSSSAGDRSRLFNSNRNHAA